MRWYEWVSIAVVLPAALLCSVMIRTYLPCRCYMLTQDEQHAVWRASSLAKWMAHDWRVSDNPDRQHRIEEYTVLSDTLYDLLRRRGRTGSLRDD
jgi:hypothetical protein